MPEKDSLKSRPAISWVAAALVVTGLLQPLALPRALPASFPESPFPEEPLSLSAQQENVSVGKRSLHAYELYARITTYHNVPGDRVNGGSLNFMGRKLLAGYSAAGPSVLAGYFVEVPDFNSSREAPHVSNKLRRFLREKEYNGLFVIDDIGSSITFLKEGKSVQWQESSSLDDLSTYSLRTGDPVVDIDIMIPDRQLAESYSNDKCLIRIFKGDIGGFGWTPSASPVWKGRKPLFDTRERYERYISLLTREKKFLQPVVANFFH